MEVDFAFLAEAAEASGGKLNVLGGAMDTIWSAQVPISYPKLSFAMRLIFSAAEIGRKHKIEINIIDEDGKNLATVGGDLEAVRNPNLPQGWKQGIMAVMNFVNLNFTKFGDYSFEVVVNNSSLKSVPLRVAQKINFQTSQ